MSRSSVNKGAADKPPFIFGMVQRKIIWLDYSLKSINYMNIDQLLDLLAKASGSQYDNIYDEINNYVPPDKYGWMKVTIKTFTVKQGLQNFSEEQLKSQGI